MKGHKRYNIAFYKLGNRFPVIEFMKSKNRQGRAKINFFMDLLMEKGTDLLRPYGAYLRDKIWELRPGIGTEEYRMLYFFKDDLAVFVHAVDKKDFKRKDIDIAVKRMKELI